LQQLLFLLILASTAQASPLADEARRILTARCGACHAQNAMGGLRLDTESGFRTGGKSGRPAAALLLTALRGGAPGIKAMPPGKPLPASEIDTLSRWLDAGAPWPQTHWAFQPLPPATHSLDYWLDAGLARHSLTPAPPADRRTLIRRLSFDLTGLPPFYWQIDDQPGWEARLVDQLLASPHFGEHWGRHWLDVARYGEDDFSGTAVQPYPNAWRYRDWVVNALNRNLPYNKFLMHQIAGDLMGDPAGTGFMGLGPWYYGIAQPPQARADERHDRIDVVSRGMLGVTLACARCHDHKYDPFTQKDYFALAGVFSSTAYKEYPLVPAAEAQSWQARKQALDAAEKALKTFLDEQANLLREQHAPGLSRYMLATLTGDPTGLHPVLYERWCNYLQKPEEFHPFLKSWFASPSPQAAEAFETLLLDIAREKKIIDAENKAIIAAAEKAAAKPLRTIILPGGYRSEEDFNPNAGVPIKSLERNRFVAYNRIFLEGAAPLSFPPDILPQFLAPAAKARYDELLATRDRLKQELPPKFPYFDGLAEFEPHDLPVDLRGNPETPGEIVPRRFPLVLSNNTPLPLNEGSGRRQLAHAVAHHPLAARVAVNRVWLHLFGEGLVRTPSNFGLAGDRPAHPELLDYLAARFVELNYDLKALIREIVLSRAYQRSSAGSGDNRYFARQNRKRLSAEPLRDAMLAVSGALDLTIGGPSAELTPQFRRRTLYAKVSRFQPDETLSLFDHPSAAVTCEQRAVTNVPLQKLFFLNSELVLTQAAALGRLIPQLDLETIYHRAFFRPPSAEESQAALQFLTEGGSYAQLAQVLLATNEFAYVD
jgi:cytochrome c553